MDDVLKNVLRRKEAIVKNAREISEIEREINSEFGGDCGIRDLVAIMVLRGWTPPTQKAPTD